MDRSAGGTPETSQRQPFSDVLAKLDWDFITRAMIASWTLVVSMPSSEEQCTIGELSRQLWARLLRPQSDGCIRTWLLTVSSIPSPDNSTSDLRTIRVELSLKTTS